MVVGSSIAGYSVLPDQLETRLQKSDARRRVFLLSHQGLNGLDLSLYTPRLLELKPDVIVVPVNMVDFRLERPLMTGELARLSGPDRPDALLALEADLYHPEIRALAPGEALRQMRRLPRSETVSALLLARLSALYRYEEIGLVPLRLLLSHRFSAGRSYLHYAGMPIDGEGVTKRGWTSRRFSFILPDDAARSGWEIQGHPATPKDSLFALTLIPADARDDSCSDPHASPGRKSDPLSHSVRTLPLRPGWQRISFEPGDAGKRVCVVIKPGVWADEESDTLGVRLTEFFGRKPAQIHPVREVRREDVQFKSMTDAEYRVSFDRRILRFDRAGMEYLNALEMAKKTWAVRAFDPEIPALALFARWKEATLAAGVNVLVVEAPENPISRSWLETSDWARGFSQFLAAGDRAGAAERGRLFYAAETKLLPMQSFSDYHHLTYFGAEVFTDRLAARLESLLEKL